MDRDASPAFVRRDMLPPQAPPNRQAGLLRWLRENLFSGWLNTLLTVLSLAVIWSLIRHFWPWFAHSVWHANSLAECRQIIAQTWGDGATGACFAVIRVRWHQYIFGFYPRAEYWRPILTMGLLFIALAPVLFSVNANIRRWVLAGGGLLAMVLMAVTGSPHWAAGLMLALMAVALLLAEYAPHRLLVFTVLYPVLAVWLLWGEARGIRSCCWPGWASAIGCRRWCRAGFPPRPASWSRSCGGCCWPHPPPIWPRGCCRSACRWCNPRSSGAFFCRW